MCGGPNVIELTATDPALGGVRYRYDNDVDPHWTHDGVTVRAMRYLATTDSYSPPTA